MSQISLVVLSVVLALLAERVYSAPRDIRRNSRQIARRNEDLESWIEQEDKALTNTVRKLARRIAELNDPEVFEETAIEDWGLSFVPPKRAVLGRLRDQVREVARLEEDIEAGEQVHHRVARWILVEPLPRLDPLDAKREIIERWESSLDQDELVKEELNRAVETSPHQRRKKLTAHLKGRNRRTLKERLHPVPPGLEL